VIDRLCAAGGVRPGDIEQPPGGDEERYAAGNSDFLKGAEGFNAQRKTLSSKTIQENMKDSNNCIIIT
jgi:hypothetical protein